jgi:hypothetical protein
MSAISEIVRLQRKTGSDRRKVKVMRLTPSRHGAAAAAAPDQGGEARLDLSEGSAVVMMLALRDSPWRQPRNPARHISPKALVLRAECLLERRFFDHHHPDMKKKPE